MGRPSLRNLFSTQSSLTTHFISKKRKTFNLIKNFSSEQLRCLYSLEEGHYIIRMSSYKLDMQEGADQCSGEI